MAESIKLNIDEWKIRIEQRSRGRMKIIIKMNREEAVAYKNFEGTVRPADVKPDIFAKSIFFNGIEAMNKELSKLVEEYIKNNPDASGFGGDFSSSSSASESNVEIITEVE